MWKHFEIAAGDAGRGVQHYHRFLAFLLLALGLGGCYTVLQHPGIVNEETGQKYDSTYIASSPSCTDCHNNQYDHRGYSSHLWGYDGWDSWGTYWGGFYPYQYYNNSPWSRYYYDPWWGGYGGWYGSPYPYYPYPGGGGSSGSSGPPPPDRPETRRGMPPVPPTTPAPPPTYNPPPPQNQGQGQQENPQQQNNNNDQDNERRGRRGKS